ncbi:helix-turn-helix domain-containing protein [Streptomyces asoensis]|uniref:helix-turn-helix domain-containing protein n=1 Tax=Streptomyces asoensis TaxID=249586 RepID=UPI0036AF7C9F
MPEYEDLPDDEKTQDAARKRFAEEAAVGLARRLLDLHTATGQKQRALAEHLKVGIPTVSRYLSGSLVPRPRQLRGMLVFFRARKVNVTAQEEEELTSLCRDAQRTVERLREVIDAYKEDLRSCREQVQELQAEDLQAGIALRNKLSDTEKELADLRCDVEQLSSDNQFYRAANEHYLTQEAQHIAWQGTPQEIELKQQVGELQAEIEQLQSKLVLRLPDLRVASDAVRAATASTLDAAHCIAVGVVDAIEGVGALTYVVIIAISLVAFGPEFVLFVKDVAGPWAAALAILAAPLVVGAAFRIVIALAAELMGELVRRK